LDIYEPINQALTRVDALMNAAEAHGILCGMLCGEHKIDKALWIKHVLGETVNGDILADEAGRRLSLLKAYTFEKLDAPECSFTPLLPDDEQSIFVRTQALGGWCEGFLFGMGLCGVKNLKAFPENLQEFIEDVMSISRIAPVNEAHNEEDEESYMQLIEYIRVGVMDIYQEHLKKVKEESPNE